MTTINMQYWLGANERTHVLPTETTISTPIN